MLALGMRRVHRLHLPSCIRPMIYEKDFDLKMNIFHPIQLKSKRISMVAFIWFCKLSEIMTAMTVFQRKSKFSRDWTSSSDEPGLEEVEQVFIFEGHLKSWREGFETAVLKVIGYENRHLPLTPVSTLLLVNQ